MADFQPPTGSNFATSGDIPALELSMILKKVSAFLQAASPYAKLERYDDWWEHDGLHFHRSSCSFDELFEIIHSPKSLLESMPGDFCVFVGVYSEQVPFYLRFYVDWNDDETEVVGRFDVTVPNDLAPRLQYDVLSFLETEMSEKHAADYYRSINE